MAGFVRCRGKTYCVENEQGCRVCGRSHEEISATRRLIEQATQLILEQDYANTAEFTSYLAEKIESRVRYRRQQSADTGGVD